MSRKSTISRPTFALLAVAASITAMDWAKGQQVAAVPKVDFSYAFATPHRITVGRPDASDRTLLDLQPGSLRMAWTYDNLSMSNYPPLAFRTPPTLWSIQITPQIDGKPLARSRWTRLDSSAAGVGERLRRRPRLRAIGSRQRNDRGVGSHRNRQQRLESASVRAAVRFGQLGREPRMARCSPERGRQPHGRLERAGRSRADPRHWRRCLFAPSRRRSPGTEEHDPRLELEAGRKTARLDRPSVSRLCGRPARPAPTRLDAGDGTGQERMAGSVGSGFAN